MTEPLKGPPAFQLNIALGMMFGRLLKRTIYMYTRAMLLHAAVLANPRPQRAITLGTAAVPLSYLPHLQLCPPIALLVGPQVRGPWIHERSLGIIYHDRSLVRNQFGTFSWSLAEPLPVYALLCTLSNGSRYVARANMRHKMRQEPQTTIHRWYIQPLHIRSEAANT